MKWSALYIAAIVAANYGFSVFGPWMVFGAALPPMTFVVGAVFVLRDYAQRDIGHWIFVPIIIGVGLSLALADPFIAVASGAAFAISEITDWAVFTATNKPLKSRILISSAISVPADSVAFLLIAGFFSWPGLAVMVASKMLAAMIVWVALK